MKRDPPRLAKWIHRYMSSPDYEGGDGPATAPGKIEDATYKEYADSVPETADGVPVVAGMTVWWTLHGIVYGDYVLSVTHTGVLIIPKHGPDFARQVALLFSDCYGTREAAKAEEK